MDQITTQPDEGAGSVQVDVTVDLNDPGDTSRSLFEFDWSVENLTTSADDWDSYMEFSGHAGVHLGIYGTSKVTLTFYVKQDAIAEPTESFKFSVEPSNPNDTVNYAEQTVYVLDNDFVIDIDLDGTGTAGDPDGIEGTVTVTDYNGTPAAGQDVSLDFPQNYSISIDTPNGVMTDSAGQVRFRFSSIFDHDDQMRAQVSGHSQLTPAMYNFNPPVIKWGLGATGKTSDSVVKGGFEFVEGKIYKTDGATPFPNAPFNLVLAGDLSSWDEGGTSDNNGQFGVWLSARSIGAEIGTATASFAYVEAGDPPVSRTRDADLKINGIHPSAIPNPTFAAGITTWVNTAVNVTVYVYNADSGRKVVGYYGNVGSFGITEIVIENWSGATDENGYFWFDVRGVDLTAGPKNMPLKNVDGGFIGTWTAEVY